MALQIAKFFFVQSSQTLADVNFVEAFPVAAAVDTFSVDSDAVCVDTATYFEIGFWHDDGGSGFC